MLKKQVNLKDEIDKSNDFTWPKNQNKKEKNLLTYENRNDLPIGRQIVFNGFQGKIFPIRKKSRV